MEKNIIKLAAIAQYVLIAFVAFLQLASVLHVFGRQAQSSRILSG